MTVTDIRPDEEKAHFLEQVRRPDAPARHTGIWQHRLKDGRILDVEGDPDSPISQGCLCPKGAATFQLVTGDHREKRVLYRAPRSTRWKPIPLDVAMEMVAERVRRAREETWEPKEPKGRDVNRTLGIAHLGGATLDNEENYLLKKLYTALGVVQVENQARI